MIWLIGNKGMLGYDVEKLLSENKVKFWATDKEVDITDYKNLEKFGRDKEVDWVINCAAYTNVDQAEEEAEIAFNINQEGVRNVALFCSKRKAKLIHISTDYVYDGSRSNFEYCYEEDEPNPLGVYGKSKLAGEEAIRKNLAQYFIIRTAWLYGINGSNFVNTMLRLFNEKQSVRVVKDQYGAPTYSKDLAQASLAIVEKDTNDYGVYHFSNIGRTNWYNFAKEIYLTAKKLRLIDSQKEIEIIPIKTEEYPTAATRPKNTILCKDKIVNVFGIEIRSWIEALEDYLHELSLQNKTN